MLKSDINQSLLTSSVLQRGVGEILSPRFHILGEGEVGGETHNKQKAKIIFVQVS